MDPDDLVLFLFQWAGAAALCTCLVVASIKIIARETLDLWDWFSEARRAKGSGPLLGNRRNPR